MRITTDDVAQVAALASLDVPEGDAQTLADQLSRIVEYMKKLEELDTDDVVPTTQVVKGRLHSARADEVEPRTGTGDAGQAVKFFNVPRVITGR